MTGAWEDIAIDIAGLRLGARVIGPADGAPMLCLHGWLDNAASFEPLGPRLAGFRIVALDLPGHGHSAHRPEGSTYPFIDAVADVAAARDALGWQSCVLLGHSLGAAIAATLAGAEPARVSRLVLLEGIGPLTEAPEHTATRLGRALEEQRNKAGRRPPIYPDAEHAAQRLATSISRLGIEAARILCRRGLVEVGTGVTWRSDPRVRWQSRVRLVEDQVLALLRAITCPTLFVRADDGYVGDGAVLAGRTAAIADLRTVALPGGHHVHLEDPDAVAAVVAPFLAPLRPGP